MMRRVGELSDATAAEVAESRRAYRGAADALAPFKRLLHVWSSEQFGNKGAHQTTSIYAGAIVAGDYTKTNPQDKQAIDAALAMAADKRFFHWELEFPEVFYDQTERREDGGFDAVVGNPPYVATGDLRQSDMATWQYYKSTFVSASGGKFDIYLPFLEQSRKLVKLLGKSSFILPNKWLKSDAGEPVRKLFSQKKVVESIVDFGSLQIFQDNSSNGPTTYTCICTLSKVNRDFMLYARVNSIENDTIQIQWIKTPYDHLGSDQWTVSTDFWSQLPKALFDPLEDIATVFVGTSSNADPVFILQKINELKDSLRVYSEEEGKCVDVEKAICIPFLRGKDIERFGIANSDVVILFPYQQDDNSTHLLDERVMESQYPLAWQYLKRHRSKLEAREDGKWKGQKDWYCHSYPRNHRLIRLPKILTPDICNYGKFAYDDQGVYHCLNTVYGITNIKKDLVLEYLICVLNSSLFENYIRANSVDLRGGYYRVTKNFISPFPIRRIAFTTPAARRTALGEEGRTLYARSLADGAADGVLDFVAARLAAPPDEADVVHDLLAHLAEVMIRLNRDKRTAQTVFLDGLVATLRVQPDKEGHTGLDALTGKTALADYPGDYQKAAPPLTEDEFFAILQKNQARLGARLSDPAVADPLRAGYRASLMQVLPLKDQLARTDGLIDQIVYRLYGLTEDEVAVVEGV